MVKKILLAVGIITILAGIVWAGNTIKTFRVNARTAQFNADVDNLFRALQKYKEQTGSYPAGSNLDIARALQGHNSRNVIVVIGSKITTNDKGEFIDPWGTPLRIYFSESGVLIRSAGPNRRFDDSTVIDADDYYRSN